MRFSFFIARKYAVSRKSHNIINVISGVSAFGVMAGSMVLIIILSVFNGFEGLVKSLFNTFNPDLLITSAEGKFMESDTAFKSAVEKIPGVISYSEVIQEKALLKYGNEQYIATLKGVDSSYFISNPLNEKLIQGAFPDNGVNDFAILGYGAALYLGINMIDFTKSIQIYVPRRTKKNYTFFSDAFNRVDVLPVAIFSLQQEIDDQYVIISLEQMKTLLELDKEISHIEIRVAENVPVENIRKEIMSLVDTKRVVKDRYEQEALLYKVMQSEKWAIFFILGFVIIIATFNLVGSLSMIILDKKQDISVLFSMGATAKTIRKVFMLSGIMINLSGVISGLILGYIICLIQDTFGIIKLGSNSDAFIIPYYPVEMQALDFLYVFMLVLIIGTITSWFSVRKISQKYLQGNLQQFARIQ